MTLNQTASELEQEYRLVRRHLHRIPETALEEYETSRYLKEQLEQMGLKPMPIGTTTGITALIRGEYPGPVIALRSDMDGLPIQEQSGLEFASQHPGRCHACGHDVHMAALLLAGRLLLENREKLHGTVKLIFQPGEEGQKGARVIMEQGVLENPRVDFIAGAHVMPELDAGRIGLRNGAVMAASDRMYIRITGRGGHGAHPEECIDPIMAAVHVIDAVQTILSRELKPSRSAVVSFGAIHGGSTENVIPGEVELKGTVRSLEPEVRSWIHERIRQKAAAAAAIEGAGTEVSFHLGVPPVISDPGLLDILRESAGEALAAGTIQELSESDMCGEDFGGYLERIPGVFFRVGTGSDDPDTRLPLHAAGIRFEETAIRTMAVAMAAFALKSGTDRKEESVF